MAISISNNTSGFRKWSEARELRKLDDTRGETVRAGDIADSDVGQEVTLVVAVIERDGADSRALGRPGRPTANRATQPLDPVSPRPC